MLLAGLLLGLHVNFALPVAGGVVPNIIALPFATLLMLSNWRRISGPIAIWSSALVAFFLASGIWGMAARSGTFEGFIPAPMLCYTLLLALAAGSELAGWRIDQINRFALTIVVGLLLLSIIEMFTPLRLIAEAVTRLYTANLETDLVRDELLYGGYRPRLFSSEPSRAACSLAFMICVWAATLRSIDRRSILTLAGLTIGSLLLIRSPFLILPIIFMLGKAILWSPWAAQHGAGVQASRFVAALVGAVAAFIAAGLLLGEVFSNRIANFDPASDWSVTVRTYGALQAGLAVAGDSPLGGAGANNFEAARPLVAHVYRQAGVPAYVTEADRLEVSVNNGLASALWQFGYLGTALYFALLHAVMAAAAPSVPWSLRWLAAGLVALPYAELYSPAYMVTLFLLLAGLEAYGRQARSHRPRSR